MSLPCSRINFKSLHYINLNYCNKFSDYRIRSCYLFAGNMLKSSTKLAVLRQTRSANPSTAQFCNYSPRVCMRTRLDGYEFCVRHILEDKNSPYKQCTYVSGKTNRRCTAAAPRLEKRDGYASGLSVFGPSTSVLCGCIWAFMECIC